MERRKILIQEYKHRRSIGGVYRVTNSRNGMFLLDFSPNIQAKQNAFDFMVFSSSCFHHKLKKDWATFGGNAFTFEILETLDKKEEQNQEEFLNDLKILEQIWSEKLDSSKRY